MTIRFRLLAFLLPVQLFIMIFFLALFFYQSNKEMTSMMLATAILMLAISIGVLYFIAYKIVEPLNTLKNAALVLAAGDYEEKIDVKGPKEIVELAHTLNTMRECLVDHVNRLHETSYLREKIFGEQECAQVLVARMVDGEIERFSDSRLILKHLTAGMSSAIQGLKLSLNADNGRIVIFLQESEEEGFEEVYLLAVNKSQACWQAKAEIDYEEKRIALASDPAIFPLFWSTGQEKFIVENPSILFKEGDYLFFLTAASSFLGAHKLLLREAMHKVLRQFAYESFDLLTAMIASEINFLLKKANAAETIHIFCIKF
jgi:HAMP domain-containing protein